MFSLSATQPILIRVEFVALAFSEPVIGSFYGYPTNNLKDLNTPDVIFISSNTFFLPPTLLQVEH